MNKKNKKDDFGRRNHGIGAYIHVEGREWSGFPGGPAVQSNHEQGE